MKRLLFVAACVVLAGVGLLYGYGKSEGSKQNIEEQAAVDGSIGYGISAEPAKQEQVDKAEVNRKVAKLHIPFIANEGQTDEGVKFYASTFGGTVFVTDKGEIVYSLPKFGEKVTPHFGPFDKAQDGLPPQWGKGASGLNSNPEPRIPQPSLLSKRNL